MARNPVLDLAYLRLGELALERREGAQARRYLDLAASLAPGNAPVRAKLALALQLEGDVLGADRALKQASELDPENLEYLARLGLLHAERFHRATRPDERKAARDEAVRYLQEVLKRQPENAIASRTLQSVQE